MISGDWGNFTGGMIEFKGDQVCFYKNYCGSVFRNPGAPKTKENEYIWYDQRRSVHILADRVILQDATLAHPGQASGARARDFANVRPRLCRCRW